MLVHSMLNFINFEFFFNNTGHSRTAWIFITRPEFSIYRSIAIYIIRISKYIYIYIFSTAIFNWNDIYRECLALVQT